MRGQSIDQRDEVLLFRRLAPFLVLCCPSLLNEFEDGGIRTCSEGADELAHVESGKGEIYSGTCPELVVELAHDDGTG